MKEEKNMSSHNSTSKEQQQQQDDAPKTTSTAGNLLAGGVAGSLSRTVTAPLDRLKTMIQEGEVTRKLLSSEMDEFAHPEKLSCAAEGGGTPKKKKKRKVPLSRIIRHTYEEGGVRSFWRGNGVNCFKIGPEFALVFALRQGISDYFDRKDTLIKQHEEYNEWRSKMSQQQQDEVDSSASTQLVKTTTASHQHHRQAPPQSPNQAMPGYFTRCFCDVNFGVKNFVYGAFAGGTSQTILYPLEVVKTRIAVSRSGEYSSIMDCVRQSYARGGGLEFYRGLSANLAGIIPYRGLEVGIFFTLQQSIEDRRFGELERSLERQTLLSAGGGGESASSDNSAEFIEGKVALALQQSRGRLLKEAKLSVGEIAVAGMFSSIIAQTVTYPLNLTRTLLQTQGVNGRPKPYDGLTHCMVTVVKHDGFGGLFRGILPNYLKAVPASTATFVVYDAFQQWYRRHDMFQQVAPEKKNKRH